MDALYTVKSEYTYKEYRKLSYCSMKASWGMIAIACAVLIALLVYDILQGYWFFACWITGALAFVWLLIEHRFKKAYKDGGYKDDEVTICFYEDYMEGISKRGNTKVLYKNLYQVIETKTSFYIMMGNNMGFIAMKENCTEELCEFIRKLKVK